MRKSPETWAWSCRLTVFDLLVQVRFVEERGSKGFSVLLLLSLKIRFDRSIAAENVQDVVYEQHD